MPLIDCFSCLQAQRRLLWWVNLSIYKIWEPLFEDQRNVFRGHCWEEGWEPQLRVLRVHWQPSRGWYGFPQFRIFLIFYQTAVTPSTITSTTSRAESAPRSSSSSGLPMPLRSSLRCFTLPPRTSSVRSSSASVLRSRPLTSLRLRTPRFSRRSTAFKMFI